MRPVLRFGFLLAVGVILALPVSLPQAGGRDDTRCKGVCRQTKLRCDSACETRCLDLFPNNFEQRYACLRTCYDACAAQEKECRAACAVDRPPTSPTNP